VLDYQGTVAAASVFLLVDTPGDRKPAGSGTVIAKRDGHALILTCRHVVEGHGQHQVIVQFPGGKRIIGRVFAIDDHADLALIEVAATEKDHKGNELPTTALGDLPLVAGDQVQAFGYGPADHNQLKPMNRAGVCRGAGGMVQGKFGHYQSVDLAMYGHSGDSGCGVFRTSSGYLVGVLWGGDGPTSSFTSNIVPLPAIRRFVDLRCRDWLPGRVQQQQRPPATTTLPPPPPLPSNSAPPGAGPAPAAPQPTLAGPAGPPGPQGPPGPAGAPGQTPDVSNLTITADRAVEKATEAQKHAQEARSGLEKALPVVEAVAPWLGKLPAIFGLSVSGPAGLAITLGGFALRAWLRRRRSRSPGSGSAPAPATPVTAGPPAQPSPPPAPGGPGWGAEPPPQPPRIIYRDTPPPPQVVEHEREYVTVKESDGWGKAYGDALALAAQNYPGHLPLIKVIESMARQNHSGMTTKERAA
jgi:small nuclear ribonucleoprotein (snRNP)-like protein